MITVKQETEIVSNGTGQCNGHAFISRNRGKISLKNMSHTQEKVCFNCGRFERVVTKIVKYNPFTFDAVVARFQK